MRRGFFWALHLALPLVLLLAPRAISAQAQERFAVSQAQSDQAHTPLPELAQLPTQLTDQQSRALQLTPPAVPARRSFVRHRWPGFYKSAYNSPLTPRQVAYRESVEGFAARHNQFVHVRLASGKVLTGNITFTSVEGFWLQTHVLSSGRMVLYRELAEAPRAVLAVGAKTVRGLEVTGLVVGCIVFIPVAVVIYPLIAAGIIQD